MCLFVFQCGCDARYRDTVVEKQRGENNKQVVRKTWILQLFAVSLKYRVRREGPLTDSFAASPGIS